MATKGKDVGSTGKDKKGTSLSKPVQSGSSKSSKPSPNLESTTDNKDRSSSSSSSSLSRKHIPSYLKPTISSQNVKKDESTVGPSVQRRRSLDNKPPSPSQTRKGILSSNDRRPARSSSLTPAKPVATAPKPASRTPRLVKSQISVSKSVGMKKATTGTAGNLTSKKEVGSPSSVAPEIKGEKVNNGSEQEEQDSLVRGVQEEEEKIVDKVVEIPSGLSNVNVENSIEHNSDQENEKLNPCDETSTVAENQEESQEAGHEESTQEEKNKISDQESKGESYSSHNEENPVAIEEAQEKEGDEDAAENPIITKEEGEAPPAIEEESEEDQNKGSEEPDMEDSREGENKGEAPPEEINEDSRGDENKGEAPEVITENSRGDENKGEAPPEVITEDSREDYNKNKAEEEEDDEGIQKHVDEVKQEDVEERQKNVVEEETPDAENAKSKQQTGNSKKDSQDQNEVIEETASKLLEKRKNKVKALVGAFETVISLQEPEA